MRRTALLLSVLMVVLVGCGPKDTAPTPAAAPAETKAPAAPALDTTGLKDKVIGDWTLQDQQGATTVDANISVREDGTFSNAGKVASTTPGQDGDVSMEISYSIDGKWTLEGDTISTTPDKVVTKVEKMDVKAKNPANQASADSMKGELTKQAEEQTKASLDKASSTKIKEATADQLTLVTEKGVTIVYHRKK